MNFRCSSREVDRRIPRFLKKIEEHDMATEPSASDPMREVTMVVVSMAMKESLC